MSPMRVAGLVVLPFAAAYFLSLFFRSINAIIAPDLVSEFGVSASDLGLLTAAYFLITRKVREKVLAITKDQIYDMVVWAALGVFIGGRLGYTLFYNFSYYAQHPLKIFAVWEGGMSFHGGLLGTIVSLIWFSKRQGIPVYTIGDLAPLVVNE